MLAVFRRTQTKYCFVRSYKMEPLSDLTFIKVKNPSNPATLFEEWIQEAKENGARPLFMTLATATKRGEVSSRTVAMKEVLPDASIVFTSQECSTKIRDIKENPQVAATLLLAYSKDNSKVARQVNYAAIAEKLPQEKGKVYFENQSLSAKIRSVICQEGVISDWNDLKRKHDDLLKEITDNNKVLQMPDSMVAYKIVPYKIEFYSTDGVNKIGDRILFQKSDDGTWNYVRLMP